MFRLLIVLILASASLSAQSIKPAPLPSVQATPQSIMGYPGFIEPLRPVVDSSTATVESELVAALQVWSNRRETEDHTALENFVTNKPLSIWTPSLQYNLGKLYYASGYFSLATSAYEASWKNCASLSSANGLLLGNQAAAELAVMYARVGRKTDLKALLDSVKDRSFTDDAGVQIQRAYEGLSLMLEKPGVSFRCGPYALSNVCQAMKGLVPDDFLKTSLSTDTGFSLTQVAEMADKKLQMPVKMIKWSEGATIPVPSVMHLRCGHYGALIREENGYYLLKDPTFGNDTWMSRKAVLAEGSGYFVAPVQKVTSKHIPLSIKEGDGIFGKGHSGNSDLRATTKCDLNSNCSSNPAMAGYGFHFMLASLTVSDTPVIIPAPFGPSIGLTVRYNQREAYQPSTRLFTHFSPQWVTSLVSYLEDNPANLSADVTVYLPDGGSEINTGYTSTGASQGSFTRHRLRDSQLVRIGAGQYERLNPDGSKLVYDLAIGTLGPSRKVFLTKMVDAWGNALTFNYNTLMPGRIESLTDATGQSLYFFYENATDTYLVTKVADNVSFAAATRKASFAYELQAGKMRLVSITDPVGIVSSFKYDATGFLNTLATPYGITTFATGEPKISYGLLRWVESTDAYGDKERLEYRADVNETVIPNGPLPTGQGLNLTTYDWDDRNSFYWDKKAWNIAPGDFSKAHNFHWLQVDGADLASGVLEREKTALENHVWYNYPGQTAASMNLGTSASPSIIARAIEGPDGVTGTQILRYEYHPLTGKLTRSVDAEGHEMQYTYDATGYDLLSVAFKDGAAWTTVFTASNYVNHRPQTTIDASGAVTNYVYNSKGQISQVTRTAGTETLTTRSYFDLNGDGAADEAGYPLRSEHNAATNPAQMVAMGSLTYDALKRPRTVTSAEGYTVTYDYDALDRLTLVTHPDGTTEQYVYVQDGKPLLKPTATKDRAGRWSRVRYDALGQMVMSTDPALRITLYQWCKCGALSKLTDPMGKVTFWKRDIVGKVTEKRLSDGKKYVYTYQPLSGRLDTVAFPIDVDLNRTTYALKYSLGGQLLHKNYTDAAMADVSFTYNDPLGRQTTMTDGIGLTTNNYVPFGSGGGSGKLFTVNGPFANDTLRYGYDAFGRGIKSEVLRDDGTVTRSEVQELDGMERVKQTVNGLGTFTSGYGANNLSQVPDSVTMPLGFVTNIARYPANAGNGNALALQSIEHRSPDNSVWQKHEYAWNAVGDLVSWKQPGYYGDNVWNLSYDEVGQIKSLESLLSDVQRMEIRTWQYDGAGNMLSSRLTNFQINNFPTTYEIRQFSGRNQLTQIGGAGRTTVEGRVDEPSEVKINGHPAKVKSSSSPTVWIYSREMDLPAGSSELTIEAKDGAGNVKTQRYSVNVSASAVAPMEYDANGNLTKSSKGGVRPGYWFYNGIWYSYLFISQWQMTYTWDAENRLIGWEEKQLANPTAKPVQQGGVISLPEVVLSKSTWTYDGLGRRVKEKTERAVEGTATLTMGVVREVNTAWSGLEMAQWINPDGSVAKTFYESGEVGANAEQTLVYAKDHLGTVRGWYRLSDGAKGYAHYGVYGNLTNSGLPNNIGDMPIRGYTGHYLHRLSGLLLAPYRAYDPTHGRWLSEDPIGEAGGMNLYGYVGNNPIGAFDPLGLDTYLVDRDLLLINKGKGVYSRPATSCFSSMFGDPATHTFAFTTNPDGSLEHTYSWGNNANLYGWNKDQPEDIAAAKKAMAKGKADHWFNADWDPFIEDAFNDLNNVKNNHKNGIITNNCKTEAYKLLDRADQLHAESLKQKLKEIMDKINK